MREISFLHLVLHNRSLMRNIFSPQLNKKEQSWHVNAILTSNTLETILWLPFTHFSLHSQKSKPNSIRTTLPISPSAGLHQSALHQKQMLSVLVWQIAVAPAQECLALCFLVFYIANLFSFYIYLSLRPSLIAFFLVQTSSHNVLYMLTC